MKKKLLYIVCMMLALVLTMGAFGCGGGDGEKNFTITVVDGTLADGSTSGKFPAGTEVRLTPGTKAGMDFDHWELNGEKVSTTANYKFKVEKNATYKAIFVTAKPKLTKPDNRLVEPGATVETGVKNGSFAFERGAKYFGMTGLDYVLVYVYDANDNELGTFEVRCSGGTSRQQNSGGVTEIRTTNGYSFTTSGDAYSWQWPGNYYVQIDATTDIMANAIGSAYTYGSEYYFRSQLIATPSSGYGNSELSDKSGPWTDAV